MSQADSSTEFTGQKYSDVADDNIWIRESEQDNFRKILVRVIHKA